MISQQISHLHPVENTNPSVKLYVDPHVKVNKLVSEVKFQF